MPTRPAVPGVIKHQLMFRWFGQWMVTTLFVDHGATPTQDMVDADRAVVHAWLLAYWRARADDRCVARELKSYSLETSPPTPFPRAPWYPTSHVPGTGSENVIPGITFALSLRTGGATDIPKPPHGRIYHVGGPAVSNYGSDGLINTTTQGQLETAYTALKTAFDGTGDVGTWCIISYWSGGTRAAPNLRPSPLVLPITHISSNVRLDQQRRRMPRQQAFLTNWSSV